MGCQPLASMRLFWHPLGKCLGRFEGPLVGPWGVIPIFFDPKHDHLDFMAPSYHFRLQKSLQNKENIQGHTIIQETSFRTF